MKKLFLTIILLLLSTTAFPATYYVATTGNNGNDGSVGSPWLTIQYAMDTVSAGDTIIVAAGGYSERVTTTKGGSAENPITVTGAVLATTIHTKGYTLNHDYININNMTIRGDTTTAWIFTINSDVDNCIISGNIIEYTIPVAGAGNVGGFWFAETTSYITISDNLIRDMIYVTCVLNGSNHLIHGNTIIGRYDAGGDSDVFLVWGHDNTISNNDVSNYYYGAKTHVDFVQTHGVGFEGVSYNILIDSNFVHDFPAQIGMTDWIDAGMHDWTFRNNIFANVGGGFVVALPNVYFYNNTFYKVGTTHPITYRCDIPEDGRLIADGGDIRNNLFINCGTQANNGYYADGGCPNITADYNYVTAYSAIGEFPEPTGFSEVNGRGDLGDPKFLNIGGSTAVSYSLSADAPTNVGADLSATFTIDYAGNTRVAPWNIGAYEYGGITAYSVTPSSGSGYSVSPSGMQSVANSETTYFDITRAYGYSISVSGCGGSLGAESGMVSRYTTGAITENCDVTVTATAHLATMATGLNNVTLGGTGTITLGD